jgi:peptidoglycan/LPS O-acetylase OafA/YrhL
VTTGSRAYVPALDGVRGLAIALVLLCHLTGFGGPHAFNGWINYLCWYGWIGVDLFFVLSGFLITGILIDSRGGERGGDPILSTGRSFEPGGC